VCVSQTNCGALKKQRYNHHIPEEHSVSRQEDFLSCVQDNDQCLDCIFAINNSQNPQYEDSSWKCSKDNHHVRTHAGTHTQKRRQLGQVKEHAFLVWPLKLDTRNFVDNPCFISFRPPKVNWYWVLLQLWISSKSRSEVLCENPPRRSKNFAVKPKRRWANKR